MHIKEVDGGKLGFFVISLGIYLYSLHVDFTFSHLTCTDFTAGTYWTSRPHQIWRYAYKRSGWRITWTTFLWSLQVFRGFHLLMLNMSRFYCWNLLDVQTSPDLSPTIWTVINSHKRAFGVWSVLLNEISVFRYVLILRNVNLYYQSFYFLDSMLGDKAFIWISSKQLH